ARDQLCAVAQARGEVGDLHSQVVDVERGDVISGLRRPGGQTDQDGIRRCRTGTGTSAQDAHVDALGCGFHAELLDEQLEWRRGVARLAGNLSPLNRFVDRLEDWLRRTVEGDLRSV